MKRNGLGFFIFLLVFVWVMAGCNSKQQVEENNRINIEVLQLQPKDLTEVVTITAHLRPYKEAIVLAKTPGLKVTKLAVKIGDEVKTNDYLFELDKSIIRKQVEQAKLNYDTARESYQLQKEELNKLQQQLQLQQEAQLQQVLPVFQMPKPSSLQGAADINALRASIATANLQVEQARMAYSSTLQQLKEMEYTSPIDGVITQLNIMENQMVLQTAPALVVSNIDKLKVNLSVTDDLMKDVKIGQKLELKLDEELKRQGSITTINPVADPRTNLYSLEAVFENNDRSLSPGSFYRVNIIKNQKRDVLTVPKEALISEGESRFVFVFEGGRAKKRRVTLGADGGKEMEIIEGLKVGESVIVRGQEYLKDNSEVTVRGEYNENN